MAYIARYTLSIDWVPDGAGSMTVPDSQHLKFTQSAPVYVAASGALTQSLINTAITGGMTTDLEAQTATQLATMQAWSTGGN